MADERPKPKYGELAPEGWTWTPPGPPANDSDVPAPSAGAPAGTAGGPAGGASGGPSVAPPPYTPPGQPYSAYGQQSGAPGQPSTAMGPKPLNVADVTITAFLLFLGILLTASMLPALFDFSPVLSQAAAAQGYGTITPSAAANTVGVIAAVITIILQLLAIVVSVRRLQRRRLAAPFVLLFGIATFVVWVGAISYAFFSDPGFMQQVLSTTGA